MGAVQPPSYEHQMQMAAAMSGRPLSSIVYFPLTGGELGETVDDWDHGYWHEPTQGVQLTTAELVVSAVWSWDSDRSIYQLGLYRGPMSVHLVGIDGSFGARAVDVSKHPRWVPFTQFDVVASLPSEATGLDRPLGSLGLRLHADDACAWVRTGRGETHAMTTGTVFDAFDTFDTDDVMVLFE